VKSAKTIVYSTIAFNDVDAGSALLFTLCGHEEEIVRICLSSKYMHFNLLLDGKKNRLYYHVIY
jgi:hypothetical protein